MDVLNLNKDTMENLNKRTLRQQSGNSRRLKIFLFQRLFASLGDNPKQHRYLLQANKPAWASLHYLKKALELESKLPLNATNIASTHLDISALRLQLGNPTKALTHALQATRVLESSRNKPVGVYITLVIAYHKVGSIYESLHQIPEAAKFTRQGLILRWTNCSHASFNKNFEKLFGVYNHL